MSDRRETFPFGIEGEVGVVERELPATEPPAWPINEKLHEVGAATPRLDGRAKVTGAARYSADVRLPGMLYAKRFDASLPSADVLSIDTSEAARQPGVRAIHVLERVLGSAELIDPPTAEERLRYPRVRYAGQPLGAVAATSLEAAEEAARKVRVRYAPRPFVTELEQAEREDAPIVFSGPAVKGGSAGGGGGARHVPQRGNVRGPSVRARGDLEAGFREADIVLEGEFRTQVQTHSALETHGLVADWSEDGLTVYASTQGTKTVRDELAHVFGLPKSRVRVITEFMGGGFGAKFGAGNAGVLAAHLSKKAKAPVWLLLDRRQEHTSVGNRPSSRMRLRIGAKKDGTLTAIHHVSHGTAGTGTGSGTSAPAWNLYACDNVRTEDYDVFTNAGPSTAFRAPGHPQGCFSLEQSIDELAVRLGIDPLDLRDRIDSKSDRAIDAAARRHERRVGAERIGWSRRKPAGSDRGPIKRGLGMAQSVWYRLVDPDSAVEVRIGKDGSVAVFSGVQDIGTGIRTALAQVVAEQLGLRTADIEVVIGDTRFPNGAASGGSKTTASMTPAARNAAYEAGRLLVRATLEAPGVPPERWVFENGTIFDRDRPEAKVEFRAAVKRLPTEEIRATATRSKRYDGAPIGGLGGVQFCEVAVDTETGVIRVERVVAVHDCGRPINRLALESQVNGGILQGLSYALYEDRILDAATGVMVNAGLDTYKIVGAREAPEIEAIIIEQYTAESSTDAAGIGEPATVPTAAAIANAFFNATGARARRLPMTPAAVLEALGASSTEERARQEGGPRGEPGTEPS